MSNSSTPEHLVADLVSLLSVEKRACDIWLGQPQLNGLGRVFGGQVLAQALHAAQQSIPTGKNAHSLHAYFLRSGTEGQPIEYRIERDFDGRSFSNRRVVAAQEDEDGQLRPILNLTASFQVPEEGLEHVDATMPDVVPPEELKSDSEIRREVVDQVGERMTEQQRTMMLRPRAIEMRSADRLHWMNIEPQPPHSRSWFRLCAPVTGAADTPEMHRAIITYASDYTLLGTAALPHGLSWMRGELIGASLDHAVWFHSDARADEWLLYVTDSPFSGGGRGFNRGRIFTRDGRLVASVAQEGVVRKRKQKT